ncbi:S-adenosylmethionine sensor upstream of mTORC1-like [Lineus longissimus]|uniref:S-adenosylmethionine sensor upstream of mTORC1-like n=1 Tax=Lineus longissimus TaxID=88925 RepID=UPI00315CAAE9
MTMSEERAKHLELAGVVKSVHAHLRREYKRRKDDVNDLWKEHTEKTHILKDYASAMHKLATNHWEKSDGTRIDWCRDMCLEYFYGGLLKTVLEKEKRRALYRTDRTGHQGQGNSVQDLPVETVETGDGDTRLTPGLEHIADWSSIERDDLPDGCVSQREGCPDGSVNERDGCPDGSANERPMPDGSVNYRDGQTQTLPNISGLQSSRKCVELPFEGPIFLLDVGSCYNPFQHFEEFCVTALDLHPATESVLQCDFLDCGVLDRLLDTSGIAKDISGCHSNGTSGIQGDSATGGNQRNGAVGCPSDSDTDCDFHPRMLKSPVTQLLRMSYDVVVFSLLLEYLPCCKQRFTCCQKAWDLLRLNGLFLVITPDSHRQHRNAGMIKSWKQCLEGIGFQCIRYLKQEHIHCMAFRRLEYGSERREQPDMLYIPQDFHGDAEEMEGQTSIQYDPDDIARDYLQLPNFTPL